MRKEIKEKIKSLRPLLQKFFHEAIRPDNWDKNVKEICQQAGLNYDSVRREIWEYGTGDFWRLRNEVAKESLEKEMTAIYKALIKKAKKGDTKALKLALQWRGELVEKSEVKQDGEIKIKIVRERPKNEGN